MYKHQFSVSVGAFALALLLPAAGRADVPPAPVTVSATASASASMTFKISDEEALSDDILAVIDLPLAAAAAREAGVEEVELKEALEVSRDVGLSAGEASEIVAEEAEASAKRGAANKGFGQWVKMQVAAGLRGQKLAAKIRERKAELKELSPAEDEKLKLKLDALGEKNRARNLKLIERRQELVGKGKQKVLVAKERHERHEQRLAAAGDKLDKKSETLALRLRVLEDKLQSAEGDKKTALEIEKRRLQAELGRVEKAEDKLEKAEDKLEKEEDKLDKAEGKLEKKEEKLEKREEKREEKADKLTNKPGKAGKAGDEPRPPVPRPDGKPDDKTSKGPQ